jgi:hypothetical protein
MSVFVGVMLGGLFGVMLRLQVMAVSHMGVMAGLFVIVCVMVFRGGTMMLSGVFVVLSGLIVMVSARFGHDNPFSDSWLANFFQLNCCCRRIAGPNEFQITEA